jgi:hypothetical protein
MQCIDIIAVHKTACVGDDHLETNVCSTSSSMDATDHHEQL